jgi:predicted phage-related endonuclease
MVTTGVVAATALAGVGGASLVSAATSSSSTNPEQSLVDKIASKFNLDKSKVQAVFDEEHQAREAEMKQNRADALAQAVKDDKLTQAQADHITAVWKEIDDLRGDTKPSDMSDAVRQKIKDKMDALRDWLDDQNIDLKDIDGLRGPGMGGHGRGFGGPRSDDSANNSTN